MTIKVELGDKIFIIETPGRISGEMLDALNSAIKQELGIIQHTVVTPTFTYYPPNVNIPTIWTKEYPTCIITCSTHETIT